ncbi:IS3 family transposase [Streptomyces sp. NPDC004296]|uniref:IS3 family transposase n=1 Tax=Streptomyces sp. NPDC004296 TaxID=3364697 RepID=UPI0036D1DFE1
MSALYRLIHAEKATYPIVLLCRGLKVARSSYYARRAGEAARRVRQAADDALAHEITVLHIASRHTYGVPRIHAELRRLGRRVNRKRVARVMRERDIRGVPRRRRRSLTRPDAKAKPAPDLIGRDFHAGHPGAKLVGDITGSCFDNAAAESFWALLKEEIGTRTWPDRATARAEVFSFIETFYNRRLRRHRTFGYLTPAETRQRHQHALAA